MEKKEKEVGEEKEGGGAAVGADELLKLASSLSITSTKVEDSEFAIIRALRRPIRRVLYANNAESKIHLSLSLLSPSFFFPLCLFYAFCVMFTDGIVNSYFSLTFLISHAFATAATVSSTSLSSLSISSSVLLPVPRMSQSTMHHERATLSGVLKVRAKFIAKLVLNRRSRDRPRLRPRTALRSNALTSTITGAYVKKKILSQFPALAQVSSRVTKR